MYSCRYFYEVNGMLDDIEFDTTGPGGPRPTLADLDDDGDLDLVVGLIDGTLRYYENDGSSEWPRFEARTGDDNPLGAIDVGTLCGPAFGDVDGDQDLDLVLGNKGSALAYFENQGSASSPTYVAVTDSADPFAVDIAPTNPHHRTGPPRPRADDARAF